MIQGAFELTDANGNGQLDIDELKNRFDASRHPSVLNGDTTAQLVTNEFFETFEAHHKMLNDDQRYMPVALPQFGDYYHSVSSLYDLDEDFVQMMTAAWQMKNPARPAKRREANPPAVPMDAKRW